MVLIQRPNKIAGVTIDVTNPTDKQVLTFDSASNTWKSSTTPSSGNSFARVVKKVTQSLNNNLNLQDDNELFVALNANKAYNFILLIVFKSHATPDFQYAFSVPSGATGIHKPNSEWSATVDTQTVPITQTAVVECANTEAMFECWGTVLVGANAGDFKFRWAQNSSNSNITSVNKGSMLTVWEETS